MIVVVIILSWLLVNTWLSLAMCVADGAGCGDTWFELMCLAFASVLSPFIWLGILALIRKIKK